MKKLSINLLIIMLWGIFCLSTFGSGDPVLALILVGVILILWLGESLPVFVPTLILIAGTLGLPSAAAVDPAAAVFKKMADPVLGLFFCGMCLGLTLRKHGIDQVISAFAWRLSRGSLQKNLRFAMWSVACLAMWTTNSTAMAICLPAFGGTIHQLALHHPKQAKGYVIGLAMAANFGGMATPIGTAPNAIAIAALESLTPISFSGWMLLMLPLSILLLLAAEWGIMAIFHIGKIQIPKDETKQDSAIPLHRGGVILFALCVGLWLTESWHGLHPLTVGFGATALAFSLGYLQPSDLKNVDWDVLLLIAGGLLLGHLLDDYGWMKRTALALQNFGLSPKAQLGILIILAAGGSAISSNTATAILVIPMAMQVIPHPYSAIAVAAACSLGVTFSISTPANALVAGRYAVSNRDLMKIGLPIAVIGCLLLYWTVEWVVGIFYH